MNINSSEITKYINILKETPICFATASEGLTDEELCARPDKKSWSANDILAHLRVCADVWVKDIHAILTEEMPTLPYISPRTQLRQSDYPDVPFSSSFAIFIKERQELIELLHTLPLDDWSRSALVKERKQTVFSRARQMALHEETHCAQIEALLQHNITTTQ